MKSRYENRSSPGGLVNVAIGWYVAAFAGASAAFALHLLGLGVSLIPGWVGYVCTPLIGVAVAMAIKTKNVRGLIIGVLIFAPAMGAIGVGETISVANGGVGDVSHIMRVKANILEMLVIVSPLLACAYAIIYPLISSCNKPENS